MATIEEIRTHVKDNSWFEEDDCGDTSINFITRDHGDVGEEETGAEDVKKAYGLKRELLEKYGEDALSIEVDEVDEWVYLVINIKA